MQVVHINLGEALRVFIAYVQPWRPTFLGSSKVLYLVIFVQPWRRMFLIIDVQCTVEVIHIKCIEICISSVESQRGVVAGQGCSVGSGTEAAWALSP